MHHSTVPYADVVCDIQRRTVRRVDNRSVLNVDPGSDSNRCYIAADHDLVHDG